jgi:diguanylate cyclase (GGDEF)-like protein
MLDCRYTFHTVKDVDGVTVFRTIIRRTWASLLALFALCWSLQGWTQAPDLKFQQGVLDMASWQPGQGSITLNGQWGFAWQQELNPGEWELPASQWFNMPGTWDLEGVSDQTYSGRGFASFYATLHNVPANVDFALLIPEQSTSFKLYLNDDLVASGGKVGVSRDTSEAYSGNQLIELGQLPETLRLTWQVANFHHDSGGPWQSLQLGVRAELAQEYVIATFDQALVMALALIIAGFLSLQFAIDRDDKAALALAVFALIIALRVGITANQPLYWWLGHMHWQLHIRVLYLTMMLATPAVVYWQHFIFPQQLSAQLAARISKIFLIPVLLILLLPSIYFTALLMLFQLLILAVIPVYLWSLTKVLRERKSEGLLIAGGVLGLAVCVIHDVALYSQWISDGRSWLTYGMLFFMMSLATNTLYTRSRQKKQVEKLRDQLVAANHQLEMRVAQRTVELAEKADALEEANEKLSVLANIDGLTGVLNRRAFVEQLETLARMKAQVTIIMLDVDHFKRINDEFGHAIGDEVLKRLSALLLSTKRESDRIGRFGGEEFVILANDLSADGLESFCQRLLRDIQGLTFDDVAGLDQITVSIGAVRGELNKKTIDQLLQTADQAMYDVKRSGRNNYRIAR